MRLYLSFAIGRTVSVIQRLSVTGQFNVRSSVIWHSCKRVTGFSEWSRVSRCNKECDVIVLPQQWVFSA